MRHRGRSPVDLGDRLERRRVQEELLGRLRAAIVEGRLAPGQSLTQQELAEAYGVSRQPVRQAIEALAAEGLIAKLPHGGAIVTPLEPRFVQELYEVRAQLEALAARRAAERITADQVAELDALVRRGRADAATGALGELIEADQRFHRLIYVASGNRVLAETLGRYWSQVARVMRAILQMPGYAAEVWREHEAIAAAVRAGDGEQAAAAVVEHVLGALRLLLEQEGAQKQPAPIP